MAPLPLPAAAPTAAVVLADAQQVAHFGPQPVPLPLQRCHALQRRGAGVLQLSSCRLCRLVALVRLRLVRRPRVRLPQQVAVQPAVLCREAAHLAAQHLPLRAGWEERGWAARGSAARDGGRAGCPSICPRRNATAGPAPTPRPPHLVLGRLPRLPRLPRRLLELAVAVGGAHEVAQERADERRRRRRQPAGVVAQRQQLAVQGCQLHVGRHGGWAMGQGRLAARPLTGAKGEWNWPSLFLLRRLC